MNLMLFDDSDIVSESVLLVQADDRRYKHIVEVLKLRASDTLEIGKVNGKIGIATISKITDEAIEASFDLTKEPPRKLPLTLIVSYPRPKTLKKVLQYGASLGVKEFIVTNSYRVEKGYWRNPILKEESLRSNMLLGLEQAKDTVLPKVSIKRLFKPFVEDELPSVIENKIPIVVHPNQEADQILQVADNNQEVVLFIGPEGGLIDFEVELLKKIGFKEFTFGERIQRVEVAVCYSISKLF